MPPVGQNHTCGKGPANARSMAGPPADAAGKNFKQRKPAARPGISSEAGGMPGSSRGADSITERGTGSGGDARQQRYGLVARSGEQFLGHTGRNKKLCAGITGRVDLLRPQHGAGADDGLGHMFGNGT